jgi:hypothetical protein
MPPSQASNPNTANLSRIGITLVLPLVVATMAQLPGQCGDLENWQKSLSSGEEAFSKQHWSRAEHFFSRAVRYADRSDVGDKNLAESLKKLGEANIAAKKYREAEEHLHRAIKVAKDCGVEDREAIRDVLELAKTYRSVNLEQFGQNVAQVLKETGLDGIELLNTKDGTSRVVIKFADKFNKHITSPDINEINLDKTLTFDIHEDKDGTITLNNIKGLKVHTKVWAKLTRSSIDPHGGKGIPTAFVTAEKLGLTKTVQTVLPKPVYDRILTVVERIKHPELHSPWHKQMQEKITTTEKAPVPITMTDASKEQSGEKKAGTEASPSTPASTTSTSTSASASTSTDQQKDPSKFAAGQESTANTRVTGDVVSPVKD